MGATKIKIIAVYIFLLLAHRTHSYVKTEIALIALAFVMELRIVSKVKMSNLAITSIQALVSTVSNTHV